MNDPVQIVLIASIVILTVVFVVIGVWLALVLKEIQRTIQTIRQTAEQMESFAARLSEPVDFLGMAVELVKKFFLSEKKDERKG